MPKPKKTIQQVLLTGIADKGYAVGRDPEGVVAFVEGGVPGDVVDILVLQKKKSFAYGIVSKFHTLSKDRIEPFCRHFDDCGGCKWQNLQYSAQLHHKQKVVEDAMHRLAKIDDAEIRPIKGSDDIKYYRNKLEFSFSNKRWLTQYEIEHSNEIVPEPALGFHRPSSFDKILDIRECFLQNDLHNDIRNFIKTFCIEKQFSFYNARSHEGFMRNIIIRNTNLGEWMLIVVFNRNDEKKIKLLLEAIKEKFSFITSLMYVVNQKVNDTILDQEILCYSGKDHLVEKLGDVKFKIGPKSFFQTNSHQAKLLYDQIVEFADFSMTDNVYDLYTGLGSIALYIAKYVKQVTGIEEVAAAIEDAEANAKFNGIENTIFYAGDVRGILTDEFSLKHGKPDVIITDPPRAGMHKEVVDTLLMMESPKIVYVSCNPATQARDLALLKDKYDVVKMQPVDMFPHTHHVENVALLILKLTPA